MKVFPAQACAFLVALSAFAAGAAAKTPACDALEGGAGSVASYLLSTEHPYDCCDDTIEKCLKTRPDCPLAGRLADWICRKAAAGEDRKSIRRSLSKRALSMMRPGRTHRIDLGTVPPAGEVGSKVKLVLYACTRCPLCSTLVPSLYREVTRGRLAGKATLYVKLFPIKSHDRSTEANLAATAAGSLGKYWEFLLILLDRFDRFDVGSLPGWAAEAGMDAAAFERAMNSPKVRKALVASKKEGVRNGVKATPTLFINGRRYVGDLDMDTLVDVVEEEAGAVSGSRSLPGGR